MIDEIIRTEKEVTFDNVMPQARDMFRGMLFIYNHVLFKNPIVRVCVHKMDRFTDPQSVDHAYELLQDLKIEYKKMTDTLSDIKKSTDSPFYVYGEINTAAGQVIDNALKFAEKAKYVQNAENKKLKDYFKILIKTMKSMQIENNNTLEVLKKWLLFDDQESIIVFAEATDDFMTSFNTAKCLYEDYKIEQKNQEPSNETKIPTNKVTYQENLKETARLAAIEKANAKYQEFCLDFMRDLEKQYSASSRDLYESFINGKFKKFTERFNFPLPSNTSEGMAKEICNQIDNMINQISNIAQNSYVTSVFDYQKQD